MYKRQKFSIINLIKQLSVSFWALAAVLIVVFGVVGGVFTATESAAAVSYTHLDVYKRQIQKRAAWDLIISGIWAG